MVRIYRYKKLGGEPKRGGNVRQQYQHKDLPAVAPQLRLPPPYYERNYYGNSEDGYAYQQGVEKQAVLVRELVAKLCLPDNNAIREDAKRGEHHCQEKKHFQGVFKHPVLDFNDVRYKDKPSGVKQAAGHKADRPINPGQGFIVSDCHPAVKKAV
jgi:hypothetical protein